MSLAGVDAELALYADAFQEFVSTHDLPKEWFETPDHVAFKCADGDEYEQLCDTIASETVDGVWQIELDGRYLGSAKLLTVLSVAGYEFSWIEIMQPRPGKETKAGFAEHTEFLISDFAAAEAKLQEMEVDYELQENPGHRWINIVIDTHGREIKLNNKLLADVVVWEREQGHLKKRERNGD